MQDLRLPATATRDVRRVTKRTWLNLPISCCDFRLASLQFRRDVVRLAACRSLVIVRGSFPDAVISLATIRPLSTKFGWRHKWRCFYCVFGLHVRVCIGYAILRIRLKWVPIRYYAWISIRRARISIRRAGIFIRRAGCRWTTNGTIIP